MLVINNLAPDDAIASTFSSELVDALVNKSVSVVQTALAYSKTSFVKYNPSIIINIDMPLSYLPSIRGYSIQTTSISAPITALTGLAFKRHLSIVEDTSKPLALPNQAYAKYIDLTITLGYASNTQDVEWYSSRANRASIIGMLTSLWYGDFSKVIKVPDIDTNVVDDPFFTKTLTNRVFDTINGFPVCAYEFSGEYSPVLNYVESRNHIMIFMVKALSDNTVLSVNNGTEEIVKLPIPESNLWVQYSILDIPNATPIKLVTNNPIRITALNVSPESVFGAMV